MYHISILFCKFDFVELTFRSEIERKKVVFLSISLTYFVNLHAEIVETKAMASNTDFVQYIADVDDRDYLSELVSETCKELPEPKPKKKK